VGQRLERLPHGAAERGPCASCDRRSVVRQPDDVGSCSVLRGRDRTRIVERNGSLGLVALSATRHLKCSAPGPGVVTNCAREERTCGSISATRTAERRTPRCGSRTPSVRRRAPTTRRPP